MLDLRVMLQLALFVVRQIAPFLPVYQIPNPLPGRLGRMELKDIGGLREHIDDLFGSRHRPAIVGLFGIKSIHVSASQGDYIMAAPTVSITQPALWAGFIYQVTILDYAIAYEDALRASAV